MLAIAPLRASRDEKESFTTGDEFLNFSGENNLLESINFDDLFDGMEDEDRVLPDLEMDPEIFAEFSAAVTDESEIYTPTSGSCEEKLIIVEENSISKEEAADKILMRCNQITSSDQGDDESITKASQATNKGASKGRKSSKNNVQGKRKVKVDWTPELHRRFVQAVEQLGVDKAVPSRILELMGIDCLTRHNIASHLQKYRSHRKHLLAREAEAASWSRRRQAYGGTATAGGGGCKREMMRTSPWLVPTIGFPPPPHHFINRPLHVWGHPSMDQSLKQHIWRPKHNLHPSSTSPPPPPPPPTWPLAAVPPPHLPPPPPEPSFWHSRPPHKYLISSEFVMIPGSPCFPQQSLAPTRYPPAPVPGIPPHAMYKLDPTTAAAAPPPRQTSSLPPFDIHPSRESIDAAIGDVLSKPWLPLPLGLKPPSTESVVTELHRQGIEKIPPTACS